MQTSGSIRCWRSSSAGAFMAEMTGANGMPGEMFSKCSKLGALVPARMPECKHLEHVGRGAVVEKVTNATEEEAPNALQFRADACGPDARLLRQQLQRLPDICSNGARRCGPVLCPPSRGVFDLPCCACGYLDAKRHRYPNLRRSSSSVSAATNSPRSISAM